VARFSIVEALEQRRLLSGGNLDPSFGSAGVVEVGLKNAKAETRAIHVNADGSIAALVQSVRGSQRAQNTALLEHFRADGSLDTTFGTGGLQFIAGWVGRINRAAFTSDGKVYVAQSVSSLNPAASIVARVNANGTLDQTFGNHGTLTLPSGSFITEIATTGDNKVIVAGGSSSHPIDMTLTRLNADGTLDTGFGADHSGTVSAELSSAHGTDPNISTRATSLFVGESGSIYVGAMWELADFDFDPAGTLLASRDVPQTFVFDRIVDLRMSATDGKLIAAMGADSQFFLDFEDLPHFAALRFDRDSLAPDTSFDGDGLADIRFGRGMQATRLLEQQDGKLVIVGSAKSGLDSHNAVALARFNTDGSADTTFGQNGLAFVQQEFGTKQAGTGAADAALSSDGAIVIGGGVLTGATTRATQQVHIARVLPNDSPVANDFRVTRGSSTRPTFFTVNYRFDGADLDTTSIDNRDLRITGDGLVAYAKLDFAGDAVTDPATGTTTRRVRYKLPTPTKAGTYAVALGRGQVRDTLGRAIAPRTLGTFAV
jgi:uncharacterized delta-60 repeat protein